MIVVDSPLYGLPTNPAVKWLATQERNINKELPYTDSATETPEEYVSRTYLQFLWLPQSIMPLQFLIPALLRVANAPSSPSTSQNPTSHPLHSLLKPILLTSRASSQKYHTRISQLLAEENDPADTEEEYVCYAYQKDKVAGPDVKEGEDEYEAQERLKNAWLERMERREVQIQILLHFLLLTLPGNGAAPLAEAQADAASLLPLPAPLSPSKSKKRKRRGREKEKEKERAPSPQPPSQPLEERLESYMDKLAMWQLMRSVDSSLGLGPGYGRGDSAGNSAGNGLDKGKGKVKDDRDWMQAFCEDVVEPLFKEKLPELCALFRSKLFPDPANSDSDALDLSPPTSPKQASKRLKSSASVASSAATAGSSKAKDDAAQRARSRSLSVSLEQEKRERSRSVSIGPGALRKRAIVREVSMSTVFKGKERGKSKADLAAAPSLPRTQSQSQTAQMQPPATKGAGKNAQGTVLVAATPSKPRTTQSESQRPEAQTRLPALFAGPCQSQPQSQPQSSVARVDSVDINIDADDDAFATPTKARRRVATRRIVYDVDEDAGDEWQISSSPDVLLLGAPASQEWGTPTTATPPKSSSPGDIGGFTSPDRADYAGRSQGRILVGDTPTKAR
ncbi:hypothetical protein BV20DRAFT_1001082 [Pilatotrama ljubarskyi]|nr:hypothetical protein BV20DRAFT_1001082 [Pilatotrama ljubarskyi]